MINDNEKMIPSIQVCQQMLAHGPLLIGETHDEADAREYLIDLMQTGAITTLFLEIPACNIDIANWLLNPLQYPDTNLTQYHDVMGYMSGDKSGISWQMVIEVAHQHGIPVVFYDLPMDAEDLVVRRNGCPDEYLTIYEVNPYNHMHELIQDTDFYSRSKNKARRTITFTDQFSTARGVIIRNRYSVDVVQQHCTHGGVIDLTGVVIFAGGNHLSQQYCHDITIQALLNLPDTCVIDFERLSVDSYQQIMQLMNVNLAEIQLPTEPDLESSDDLSVSTEESVDELNVEPGQTIQQDNEQNHTETNARGFGR